jgi:hypothetical protein
MAGDRTASDQPTFDDNLFRIPVPNIVGVCNSGDGGMLVSLPLLAQAPGKDRLVEHPTSYHAVQIDGLTVFYREVARETRQTLSWCQRE